MRRLLASVMTVALLVVFVSPTMGQGSGGSPVGRDWFEVFHEDWENGGLGWTFVDRSRGGCDFHVSTYYAYDDGTPPNYSYWCGTFDYDADGGYGCGWNETLELPEIALPGAHGPMKLSFRYRVFTDAADYARAEVMYLGEYRTVWVGHGGIGVWNAATSLDLQPHDNPLKVRFRFYSDEDVSDEDGAINSDGGAFHCDEIRIYEFGTGVDYFYDDVEDGVGLCSPVDVPVTGIAPRLTELPCRAYSDPTTTTCCAPGDTGSVPPNVFCSMTSPPIYVDDADTAVVYYEGAFCGRGDSEDASLLQVSADGGATWVRVAHGAWSGERQCFCNEFSLFGETGFDISQVLPATTIQLRLTMHTNGDGIDPGTGGAAGPFVDDIWVEATGMTSAVEGATDVTWGRIKALYKD